MTFETRPGHDHHELQERSDPSQWTDLLLDIERQLYHLETLLMLIEREQTALREEGIYPAVPTLFWDNDPNGQPRYCKLSFPVGALPGGQRKQYVGCKERKIQEAKQQIARTRRHEALEEERTRLERFLRMTRSGLDRVAGSVAGYRVPDDLGLDLDVVEASAGPNPLPRESAPEWIRTRPKVEYKP